MHAIKLVFITALVYLPASSAWAGGFAEGFRSFVLGKEASARSIERPFALDQTARDCMGCHAGHIQVRASGTPMQFRGMQTTNHPMGMIYELSVRKDPQGYRPSTALHSNVRLVDGRVTCISCHQLKNENTKPIVDASLSLPEGRCTATREFTMGPRDKELCLACHVK